MYKQSKDSKNEYYYLLIGARKEEDMTGSTKITKEMHNDYRKFFSGNGCFTGSFSLKVKEGKELYQAPSQCVSYT